MPRATTRGVTARTPAGSTGGPRRRPGAGVRAPWASRRSRACWRRSSWSATGRGDAAALRRAPPPGARRGAPTGRRRGCAWLPGALERTLSDGRVLLRPVGLPVRGLHRRPSVGRHLGRRPLASARARGRSGPAATSTRSTAPSSPRPDVVANRYAFVTPGSEPRDERRAVAARDGPSSSIPRRPAALNAGAARGALGVRAPQPRPLRRCAAHLVRAEAGAVSDAVPPAPWRLQPAAARRGLTPADLRALRRAERPELRRLGDVARVARRDPGGCSTGCATTVPGPRRSSAATARRGRSGPSLAPVRLLDGRAPSAAPPRGSGPAPSGQARLGRGRLRGPRPPPVPGLPRQPCRWACRCNSQAAILL